MTKKSLNRNNVKYLSQTRSKCWRLCLGRYVNTTILSYRSVIWTCRCFLTVFFCIFVQSDKRLPSQEVEECSLCDIEILTRPPTDDTTASWNSRTLNLLLSNSFQSSASTSSPCIPIQADYCPQSVTTLCGGPALPQMTCLTNNNYFSNLEDDLSEAMDVENEPFWDVHSHKNKPLSPLYRSGVSNSF